jgi:hypothetical protein
MSTDSYFNNAREAIDIAVARNIEDMRRNGTLANYVATSRDQLINSINSAQQNNGSKVIADYQRATDVQKANYNYFKRNSDLLRVGDLPLKAMQRDAEALRHDNQNAQRQYEINQWTSGNRLDTLFVYQIIFVSILVLAIFTGMWRAGFVGTGFLSLLMLLSLVIIVLVIFYRAQYTAFTRDQRYWNKRGFQKFAGPTITPPDCPVIADTIAGLPGSASALAQNISDQTLNTTSNLLTSLGSRLTSAGNAVRT